MQAHLTLCNLSPRSRARRTTTIWVASAEVRADSSTVRSALASLLASSSWHWTFWPGWPRPSAAVCAFEPDGLRQPALNPLAEMAEDTVHQNTILATLRPALRAGWLAAGGTGPAGRDGRALGSWRYTCWR